MSCSHDLMPPLVRIFHLFCTLHVLANQNTSRDQAYPPAAAHSPIVSNGGGEKPDVGLVAGEIGRARVAPAEGVRNVQASDDNDDSDSSDDRHSVCAVAAGALNQGRNVSVAPGLPATSAVIFQPGDEVAGTARAAEGSAVGVEGGQRMLHDALSRGSASSGLLHDDGAVVAVENDQRVVGEAVLAIEGNQGGGLEIPVVVDDEVRAGGGDVDGGGGIAVDGEDRDEDGGDAAEAMPTTPLHPSSKSWFAAASSAMGLLRRWAQRTAVAVAITTSTPERPPPESPCSPAAFTASGKPSSAVTSGRTRLGAGWRRHPGAIPCREDVSCSVEEWGVRGGYRTSHYGFGCPL